MGAKCSVASYTHCVPTIACYKATYAKYEGNRFK